MAESGEHPLKLFTTARMGDPVIIEDIIALDLIRGFYLYGTHFAPGMLPSAPIATGDVIDHDGNYYASVNYSVLMCNAALIHFSRPFEHLLVRWSDIREDVAAQIKELLASESLSELPAGEELVQAGSKWNRTGAGFQYVGTPSVEFVNNLRAFVQAHLQTSDSAVALLVEKAACLVETLTPFTDIPSTQYKLRGLLSHKGVARVQEGQLQLSTPTASGGSSTLFPCVSDTLMDAIPNHSLLTVLACETGKVGMTHIGGGSTPGKFMQIVVPSVSILEAIQESVDGNAGLAELWESRQTDAKDLEEAAGLAMQWQNATMPTVVRAVRELLPPLLTNRALGFVADFTTPEHEAVIRPVMTLSHARNHEEVLANTDVNQEYDGVVADAGDRYGYVQDAWRAACELTDKQ